MTEIDGLKLHRELLVWRGFAILILLMNLTAEFWASIQRSKNWASIEAGVQANNDNLRVCVQCHVHPQLNKFWKDIK